MVQRLISSFLPRYVLAVEYSAAGPRGASGRSRAGDVEVARGYKCQLCYSVDRKS